MEPPPSIADWLRMLGLGEYEAAFSENRIDLELLPELTDADLTELGVRALGDRKKIRRAIAELPAGQPAVSDTPGRGDPERRQLTLVFCDLVGSTALSSRVDPEELREVVGSYQQACVGAVERYEGFVAKFLGDGVVAYFGFPRALEDAAERAVRAGLEIVAAVPELPDPGGGTLHARVGIATGQVVVGDLIGDDSARERAVLGETPNVAARLQALAEPDSVLISDATRRLTGATFDCLDLGEQELRGLDTPMRVHRVTGEAATHSRFEAARGRGLTSLVGRAEDRALLSERWERALDGDGQVVILVGEPGIGKSRLARELREAVARGPHALVQLQCSPYHTASSLYPVITWMADAAGFERGDAPGTRLDRLEQLVSARGEPRRRTCQLLASLLSLPFEDRYGPSTLLPEERLEQTLEVLADELLALAAPTLIVVEDVHWLDPTTRELLTLLVGRTSTSPTLLLLTARPEFEVPWGSHGHLTLLMLNRLGRRQCAALAVAVAGEGTLAPVTIDEIVARTDGIPLFVEELTAALLEADGGEGDATPVAIPETLRDSLMARLDNLGPAREVAQLGAVAGREFPYALIAAVSPLGDDDLGGSLDELCEAGLLFGHGSVPSRAYTFKHALVQDAAYESLLRSRRRELHGRIASEIEESFPEVAASQPELVAHHRTEAGQLDEACVYWLRAGERASERSAYGEAIDQLSRGVDLVRSLEETSERRRLELDFHLALGPAIMATQGLAAPDAAAAFVRARELSREFDEVAPAFDATWGLWLVHQQRGELAEAQALTDDVLAIAARHEDPALRLQAHHAAWTTLLFTGRLAACREHAATAAALYDVDAHRSHAVHYGGHDPLTCAHTTLSETLCLLGYPDQARQHARTAVAHAEALRHPFSASMAHYFVAQLHHNLLEPAGAAEWAARAVELCDEHGFRHFLARARVLRGWAGAMTADPDAGIVEMEAGLAGLIASGAGMRHSYYLALLTEALLRAGDADRALEAIDRAVEASEASGERRWLAEIQRLRGVVLQEHGRHAEAEQSLLEASEIARQQEARLLELRAVLSLARHRGQDPEFLRDRVAPLHAWFGEGLDTPDLRAARAVLDGSADT